mmetsp:Transcript_11245/g.38355  ORF Transcript_11245/g.38355 Transcript_11245/m.38355 type:complete len:247 (+) Transcript_11245:437-1177(+)
MCLGCTRLRTMAMRICMTISKVTNPKFNCLFPSKRTFRSSRRSSWQRRSRNPSNCPESSKTSNIQQTRISWPPRFGRSYRIPSAGPTIIPSLFSTKILPWTTRRQRILQWQIAQLWHQRPSSTLGARCSMRMIVRLLTCCLLLKANDGRRWRSGVMMPMMRWMKMRTKKSPSSIVFESIARMRHECTRRSGMMTTSLWPSWRKLGRIRDVHFIIRFTIEPILESAKTFSPIRQSWISTVQTGFLAG